MDKNQVLASVGTREITQNDVELLLRNLDPQSARKLDSEAGRKRILEELINQELFYLDALDNSLDTQDEFKAEIEKMKVSYLKQYSISKLMRNLSVEDKEIEEYYEQNKQTFLNPESVKASHILVDSEEQASDILKEINEGLSFEDAASKYSKCPSKSNGGDLGYFTKGRMVPEFEKVAFETDINTISSAVKTQFGYHLIKVCDKTVASEKKLEEVQDQIRKQLLANKQERTFFEKVKNLKEKYEVKSFI